jgi:hexosaminidase
MRRETAFNQIVLTLFMWCCFSAHTSAQSVSNLLPQPVEITALDKQVVLKPHIKVYIDSKTAINRQYALSALRQMGFTPVITLKANQANLLLKNSKTLLNGGKEAYQLKIRATPTAQITASANTRHGLIYALQTLRQMIQKNDKGFTLQACTINDAPYFSWRAFMLDESRHFQGKETVKKMLDEMVKLKLNIFHWHLVDNPAWRIEIKKYPLLTDVSSKGDYTHASKGISPAKWDSLYNGKPGMYYTQADIKEIVKYADNRGILIIPEIEVPGHASAAIYAYPWLGASSKLAGKAIPGDLFDITDPKVEGFLHDVLDEIIGLFPGKIIHIGGDEADYAHWKNSATVNEFMKSKNIPTYADLQVWAINGMSRYISSKGYKMIGWNEITGDNVREEKHIQAGQSEQLAPGTIVQFWDGDVKLINKAIEKGYTVVNSNRFFTYLDYDYNTTPLEKAYLFNPIPEGIPDADKNKILGLGCQMWGETTPTVARLNYMVFPRIAAYAECGWVAPDKKAPYDNFLQRLAETKKDWASRGIIGNELSK